MSSEATSQDEGGASGANPGSGGSSSSQVPTPEVAEISQGNSVATISPEIIYLLSNTAAPTVDGMDLDEE